MNQALRFVREVFGELSRVDWPSRSEFFGAIIITLVLVVLFTIFVGIVDWSLFNAVRTLFAYANV